MMAKSKNVIAYFLLSYFMLTTAVNAQTPAATPLATTTPSSSTRTFAPTMIPIQTPEMMNSTSNEPSITNKPSMMAPTMKPHTGTVPPVASEDVSVTIDTLQITFSGAQTIAASDILQFEAIIDVWFETYFNQEIKSRQRYLLLHQNRDLEQFRVPEVRSMETAYTVVSQDTSTTSKSNIVSFTQMLSYAITSLAPGKPQGYAILPFTDAAYKELLLQELVTNIDSMIELSSISTPVIIPPNTMNDSGLSTGAIAGVVVAAICGLLLMASIGYFIGKQKNEHALSKVKQTGEHRSGENTAHLNNASTGQSPPIQNTFGNPSTVKMQQQQQQHINMESNESRRQIDPPAQTGDHVLNYKDQTRTVICPIVEAIPDPKKQTNDSSIIPIASLVAL